MHGRFIETRQPGAGLTRAAIITGRNHHSVGTGVVGELATGYPGYEYRYDPPFKFTGKINKLTFKLEPEVKDPAQAKAELGPRPAPEPDPIEAPKAKSGTSAGKK